MQDDNNPLPFTLAFTALIAGALAMAISPVFVRFADIGPFASAFLAGHPCPALIIVLDVG